MDSSADKLKILIVDDEEDVVKPIAFRLDIQGFEVLMEPDGDLGFQTAVAELPDLILLDIMMPGIDGWETLTRLKRDPETAKIPVIIFTAREHSRGHQKSEEMGAADYFRKPFEPDELIELVEKHVGQQV